LGFWKPLQSMGNSPLSVLAAMHSADWRVILLRAKLWFGDCQLN